MRPISKLFAFVLFLSLAVPAGAQAKAPPTLDQLAASKLGMTCSAASSSDHRPVHYMSCSGEIPSFDGIGIDTDLSIPVGATSPLPAVLMLHGWGGDKTDWESTSTAGDGADSWHWNNVFFVSNGWVAVNTTARGFQESCGMQDQDANCTDGFTHLSDRRFETRDSQTILGKLVDAGIASRRKLAATGGSYGGGQSWLLATSTPWKSPKGTRLQLAAAVAKYPWTDLLDSLAPNGRATPDRNQSGPHNDPFGVPKESYIDGLYATGRSSANGRYDTNAADFGTDLDEQYQRVQQGEPYDPSTDPRLQGMVDSFRYRSPYDATAYFKRLKAGTIRPVPVMSIQGWTDPLFPPVQTLQMFRKLKAADPGYPITMAFGDIGHSNATNPAWQWHRINRLAWGFLQAHVLGMRSKAPASQAYSFQTECTGSEHPAAMSGRWDSLANARDLFTETDVPAMTTSSADQNPADGAATDPIANMNTCLTEDSNTTDAGAAYYSFGAHGMHLLGLPTVTADYSLTGQDAVVAFKLWDQAPDGSKTLVTRGEYRLSTGDPAQGKIVTHLYGNDWVFPAGHRIVLQITQDDSPYLRPDNEPSSIDWSAITLDVPSVVPTAP